MITASDALRLALEVDKNTRAYRDLSKVIEDAARRGRNSIFTVVGNEYLESSKEIADAQESLSRNLERCGYRFNASVATGCLFFHVFWDTPKIGVE